MRNKSCTIFVDGSYDMTTRYAGYAFVALRYGIKIHEDYGTVYDEHNSCNITGECMAVQQAVKWAMTNDFSEVNICYDYTGLAAWAEGKWGTKTIVTDAYRRFISSVRSEIKINFTKIVAHSGNVWHDYTDKLARKSFG